MEGCLRFYRFSPAGYYFELLVQKQHLLDVLGAMCHSVMCTVVGILMETRMDTTTIDDREKMTKRVIVVDHCGINATSATYHPVLIVSAKSCSLQQTALKKVHVVR